MSKQLKYRLVEFKKMNKLTYKDIATFCQVTERQVISWAQIEENEHASISADKLRLLSVLFSCSMEDMYLSQEINQLNLTL